MSHAADDVAQDLYERADALLNEPSGILSAHVHTRHATLYPDSYNAALETEFCRVHDC